MEITDLWRLVKIFIDFKRFIYGNFSSKIHLYFGDLRLAI